MFLISMLKTSLCVFVAGVGMSFATVVEESTEKDNRVALVIFGMMKKKKNIKKTQSKNLSNGLGTHSAQCQV